MKPSLSTIRPISNLLFSSLLFNRRMSLVRFTLENNGEKVCRLINIRKAFYIASRVRSRKKKRSSGVFGFAALSKLNHAKSKIARVLSFSFQICVSQFLSLFSSKSYGSFLLYKGSTPFVALKRHFVKYLRRIFSPRGKRYL